MSEILLVITETDNSPSVPYSGGALISDKYSSTSYTPPEETKVLEPAGSSSPDYNPPIVDLTSEAYFLLGSKKYYYQMGFPLRLNQEEYLPSSYSRVSYDLEINIAYTTYSTNDCIACAVSTAMQIMTYLQTGMKERFSVVWLHGNHWVDSSYAGKTSGSSGATGNDDGAYVPEVLDNLVSDGAVPFSCVYPTICNHGHLHFSDEAEPGIGTARSFVTNYYTALISQARKYRISSWNAITKTSISVIESAITTYGCALLNMYMSDDMEYDYCQDGVLRDVYPKRSGLTHVVCVVGWKTIDSKVYWICINSWGDYYGDNGFWYVPTDYSKSIYFYKMVPNITTSATWDKTKNVGDAFYVNAREWNRVEERLTRKLKNRGATYTETRQFRGQPITATAYNKMINAINSQLGTSYPSVTAGQSISAALMANLINGVNAL